MLCASSFEAQASSVSAEAAGCQSTEGQALAGRPRVAKVSAAANALEVVTVVENGSQATQLHLLQLAALAMLVNRVTRLTL